MGMGKVQVAEIDNASKVHNNGSGTSACVDTRNDTVICGKCSKPHWAKII